MYGKENIKDIYPLSPMQESMYFQALLDSSSSAGFSQVCYSVRGNLDIDIVRASIQELFNIHDVLRTSFVHEKLDRPLQVVFKFREADFQFQDLRSIQDSDERDHVVGTIRHKDKVRLFDLNRDVLMRIIVLRLADDSYTFIWSHHHIIMDGWCAGILIGQFYDVYRYKFKGAAYVPPRVVPYSSYIKWLGMQDKALSVKFWRGYLDSYSAISGIPGTLRNRTNNLYQTGKVEAFLGIDRSEALNELAKKNRTTLNVVFQVLWGILLGKYNNSRDVVFGAVVSGRPTAVPGVETIVGLFMNTIPVRVTFAENMILTQLLKLTGDTFFHAQKYSFNPLSEIQMLSPLGQHLVNHILVFQNQPITQMASAQTGVVNTSDWDISQVESFEQTPYDLNVRISPASDICIEFIFNGYAYERTSIEDLRDQLCYIIDQVLANPDICVDDLELATPLQRERVSIAFNNPVSKAEDVTIVQMFRLQVALRGAYPALRYHDEVMTYRELDIATDNLARYLTSRMGDCREVIMGIMLDNPRLAVVAILGVLKAGAVWLPIDSQYPISRKQFIIEDAAIKVILTEAEALFSLDFYGGDIIALDVLQLDGEVFEGDMPEPAPEDLAYVIYTSGSTGVSKGVMIEHCGIANMCRSQIRDFGITSDDKVLQFASFSFDASVSEIFMALACGSLLVLMDRRIIQDKEAFLFYLKETQVTVTTFPPSYLTTFDRDEISFLRVIITAGEKAKPDFVRQISDLCHYYNAYGPTECSVCVSIFNVAPGSDLPEIPIGRPLDNLKVYILDPSGRILPPGSKGEIFVEGVGLARGYLNRPELTAERFIPCPWNSDERLYKTGDLARWLPDGMILYLGRNDDQIKLRGYRVEPEEIRRFVQQHADVVDNVVLARPDNGGDTHLVCYYVTKDDKDLDDLRNWLRKSLPTYMVPEFYVRLTALPLTSHGKIDYRKLVFPDSGAAEKFELPAGELEEKILHIWQLVLGRDRIGVCDDFFTLGGHSLKATLLVSGIHKQLDVKVDVGKIFDYPTVRTLAGFIARQARSVYRPIDDSVVQEYYDLSNAQKRLWIMYQLDEDQVAYNRSSVLSFKGALNIPALERAFATLVIRHESLRTVFRNIDGIPKQQIIAPEKTSFRIRHIDLRQVPDQDASIEAIIRDDSYLRFDLETGPLLRASLLHTGDDAYVFLFSLHHIVADGMSIKILNREVAALYLAFLAGLADPLPPLAIQYRHYAVWQNQEQTKASIQRQKEYWLTQFRGAIPELNLHTDYPRPMDYQYAGDCVSVEVDPKLIARIKDACRSFDTTMFTLLLSIYSGFLSRLTGQEDIVIGTPVHGRDHEDLQGLIGMFVNMLAIRSRPGHEQTFRDLLDETTKDVRLALNNGACQYEELVQSLGIRPAPGRNPLFDIAFQVEEFTDDHQAMDQRADAGLVIEPLGNPIHASHFDLLFSVAVLPDRMVVSANYSTILFKSSTVEDMVRYYIEYMVGCLNNPNQKLKDIVIRHHLVEAGPGDLIEDDGSDFDF